MDCLPIMGFSFFADAIAAYMAGDDERCILDLALCFEILANKRHKLDFDKFESKARKLREKSRLIDSKATSQIIEKLFIDRDHVAHGRPPYILGRNDGVSIESYLEAINGVVNLYLNYIRPEEWSILSSLRLDSTRRR
jgi:hypothetical protein